jgi:hypothetical protein
MSHARTPGHHHHWNESQVFAGMCIVFCDGCNYWYLVPELPFAPVERHEPDQRGNDADRHPDEDAARAGVERDAERFYREPISGEPAKPGQATPASSEEPRPSPSPWQR